MGIREHRRGRHPHPQRPGDRRRPRSVHRVRPAGRRTGAAVHGVASGRDREAGHDGALRRADPGDPALPRHVQRVRPQSRGASERRDCGARHHRRAQRRLSALPCCSATAATRSAQGGRSCGTATGPQARAGWSRAEPARSRCSCPGPRAIRIRSAHGGGRCATRRPSRSAVRWQPLRRPAVAP